MHVKNGKIHADLIIGVEKKWAIRLLQMTHHILIRFSDILLVIFERGLKQTHLILIRSSGVYTSIQLLHFCFCLL